MSVLRLEGIQVAIAKAYREWIACSLNNPLPLSSKRVELIGRYGRHNCYLLSRKQNMSLVGFWCVREKHYAVSLLIQLYDETGPRWPTCRVC